MILYDKDPPYPPYNHGTFQMGPNATDPLNELQPEVQRERNPKWFTRS